MKKFSNCILAIFVAILMSSCKTNTETNFSESYDPHSTDTQTYHIEIDNTKEILKTIISCFDNKDKERLKTLFAASITNEYDLDSQIDRAFAIYEGVSVSYEIDGGSQKSKHIVNGQYVYLRYNGQINYIKLDNDNYYNISIIRCVVDDENPDNVGLNRITLCKDDGTKLAPIGEFTDQETFYE